MIQQRATQSIRNDYKQITLAVLHKIWFCFMVSKCICNFQVPCFVLLPWILLLIIAQSVWAKMNFNFKKIMFSWISRDLDSEIGGLLTFKAKHSIGILCLVGHFQSHTPEKEQDWVRVGLVETGSPPDLKATGLQKNVAGGHNRPVRLVRFKEGTYFKGFG